MRHRVSMAELPENPLEFFQQWYKEAEALNLKEPAAMALATADKQARPSVRIVLLKGITEKGFYFYTNLTSRKGRELIENPHASLCFYWMDLGRQVRVEGKVEKATAKEADDYFASRRRGSQLGAWASKQSQPMESEGDLALRLAEITKEFEAGPVPRPPFWSGFCLVPERIEFWQEGEYRLHTRMVYTRDVKNWKIERLYP